jgi:hypothetical protein
MFTHPELKPCTRSGFLFPGHNVSGSAQKQGEKGENECPNLRGSWILPDTLPDTPGGHADTTWLRNQAMTAVLNMQVVSTCTTCMLISSCWQTLIELSRFHDDRAKQRALEPFIRTIDKLKEHPSAASATTGGDIETTSRWLLECEQGAGCHKSEAARGTQKPSRRLFTHQ